jgi:tetraacyldisaccharide 4'-kinase
MSKSNTPNFWYNRTNIFSKALSCLISPLSLLYKAGDKINKSISYSTRSISIPVICFGNLNIGGAGKTPVCIAMSKILTENNDFISPMFLTRGYGGNVVGSEFVDLSNNASIWGDEALLLSRNARTIVSSNRYNGGMLAEQNNADIVIMDDGLQNSSLAKNISFVVVDGSYGFGNQKIIPAGPLRGSLKEGLKSADAFIVVGEDNYGLDKILPSDKPCFNATIKIKTGWKTDKSKKYLAFCGIAHPPKFLKTLEDRGLNIEKFVSFPDHHSFSDREIRALEKRAEKLGAILITTEKDHARINNLNFREKTIALPIEAHFTAQDKRDLISFIKENTQQDNIQIN